TIRLDCFYFIEPLFNLINVSSNEVSFSINFVDALKDLRYKWEHGDQVVLCTQECGSGTKPISFLELCNMGNYYCKRITRLIAVVPEVPVEGIATAFCDILMFLPQIKELDLVNYGYVEYVDRRSGNVAYSDVILHSLITHHRIPMSRLTGFIALGYYNPSERTIMELRQFKFEKFGMHGMHYGGDPIVLRQLFEEKDIKNVITYHRNYEIRDGPAFNEYNNLRESVTHFVAAEELMKVAMKRGFIKNIQVATVYQYSNNNFTDAYESILDGSKKPKKRKANTHTAMEGPLGLGTMRVFAEPDILEEVICALKAKDDGGFKMPRPLSAAKESQYRVSKLVVLNSAGYIRKNDEMKAIGSFASHSDTLEITLTNNDRTDINNLYAQLLNLKYCGQNLVLNLTDDQFVYKHIETGHLTFFDYTMEVIHGIYRKYFANDKENRLLIRISSRKYGIVDIARLANQIIEFRPYNIPGPVASNPNFKHPLNDGEIKIWRKKVLYEIFNV
ncbi:hypothetical protein ENBRE01_2710, partial [Enteropsectra breve]